MGKMKGLKGTPGAPVKLTEDLIKQICNAIRSGAYMETAASYCGIDKVSFYKWMKLGRQKPRSIYGALINALDKALADAELRDIVTIDRASTGTPAQYDEDGNLIKQEMRPDWKASAWRLERKFPKKWGVKAHLEHSGPDGSPIQTEDKSSMERMERINFLLDKLKTIKG